VIVEQCGLKPKELGAAVEHLGRITPEIIASAIGATPADWGLVSDDERIALADYLWERRQTMRS